MKRQSLINFIQDKFLFEILVLLRRTKDFQPVKKTEIKTEKLGFSYERIPKARTFYVESLCPLFFTKFLFFHEMIALQKL